MTDASPAAVEMVDLVRNGLMESAHRGHAVVMDHTGATLASWGDPSAVILPRSSCKMLQALPLVESGAADAAGLTTRQLAISCASHRGMPIHRDTVRAWLGDLGLGDDDLRCGAHMPYDRAESERMLIAGESACQVHNNCSGKHTGFLTLNKHLGGDAEYLEIDHPVQRAVKVAFEEMTGETSPGYGIDGCSAPNHACTVTGLARAMARMARPVGLGAIREDAARRLVTAMHTHPELVAGEGRSCTRLMRAMNGVVVKTGAEAVFVAILQEQGIGVALKIEDGATRASECAIAALLVRLGVADPAHPDVAHYLNTPEHNRRGIHAATVEPREAFYAKGAPLTA